MSFLSGVSSCHLSCCMIPSTSWNFGAEFHMILQQVEHVCRCKRAVRTLRSTPDQACNRGHGCSKPLRCSCQGCNVSGMAFQKLEHELLPTANNSEFPEAFFSTFRHFRIFPISSDWVPVSPSESRCSCSAAPVI